MKVKLIGYSKPMHGVSVTEIPAMAAGVYARIKDGTNPTPVTEEKAWLDMLEEFDDVQNAAKVVGLKDSRIRQFDKMIRWRERIQERSTKA